MKLSDVPEDEGDDEERLPDPLADMMARAMAPVLEHLREIVDQAAAPVMQHQRDVINRAVAPLVEHLAESLRVAMAPLIERQAEALRQSLSRTADAIAQQASAQITAPLLASVAAQLGASEALSASAAQASSLRRVSASMTTSWNVLARVSTSQSTSWAVRAVEDVVADGTLRDDEVSAAAEELLRDEATAGQVAEVAAELHRREQLPLTDARTLVLAYLLLLATMQIFVWSLEEPELMGAVANTVQVSSPLWLLALRVRQRAVPDDKDSDRPE